MAELPVPQLLRGQSSSGESHARASRRARWTAIASGLAAAGLFAGSFAVPSSSAAPLFMGLGASLVVLGLALLSLRLRRLEETSGSSLESLVEMATANTSLFPGRSLLSAALVASACFVIVAVGAYGHRFGEEVRELESGAGGFPLVAESDVPIYSDLATEDGRFELGFSDEASELLAETEVVPFRVLPGDDMSCLNLYQPTVPRLLGAPSELVERGGFVFQQLVETEKPPWQLLEEEISSEDGVTTVPAFGDFNSVMWILKSGLGRDVEIENERGETIRLRIQGLLRKSLFQRELLISEAQLLEHFPSRSGYSYFLVAPPEDGEEAVAQAMEETLGGFGFDIASSAERLQSFQAVENTYLGTFRILGGLGLLLGTIGLAVILLRNVLERRSELAALRALGFRRRRLARLVFLENGVVLVAGMVIGTVAALVAVFPHVSGGHALVPWGALAATLVVVLAVGLVAGLVAARRVLALPLLESLRAE
ncbi:MAG: ABC transporter permease [Acidobacteriota bacterium]